MADSFAAISVSTLNAIQYLQGLGTRKRRLRRDIRATHARGCHKIIEGPVAQRLEQGTHNLRRGILAEMQLACIPLYFQWFSKMISKPI